MLSEKEGNDESEQVILAFPANSSALPPSWTEPAYSEEEGEVTDWLADGLGAEEDLVERLL